MSPIEKRQILSQFPPYVPGRSIESVKSDYGLDRVVKLASNENPLGPAVTDMAPLHDTITQYYPDLYCTPLHEQLAAFYNVLPANVVLGSGSGDIIRMLSLAYIEPGDDVITADCTFSLFKSQPALQGAVITKIPLNSETHDLTAMADAVSNTTKLVFISNPNNPTGTVVTQSDLESFLDRVTDPLVILDEAYVEYVSPDAKVDSVGLLSKYPNLVLLRTFSKIYGLAPLRIGYALTSADIATGLNQVRLPFNVTSVSLKAAELALANQDHVQRSYELNAAGKTYLTTELDRLGLAYIPMEANFIYITVPMGANAVTEVLLARGVIVRSLASFGREDAIRVSVGTQSDNEIFIRELESIISSS